MENAQTPHTPRTSPQLQALDTRRLIVSHARAAKYDALDQVREELEMQRDHHLTQAERYDAAARAIDPYLTKHAEHDFTGGESPQNIAAEILHRIEADNA